MSSTWGKNIKLSLFGESHGPAIGIVIGGLPPGFAVDWEQVRVQMERRAPGNDPLSSPRKETDTFQILSGIIEGRTTGAPLAAVIPNENTVSEDYRRGPLRPGHADLTALYKYGGYADYRGGGHFSGRLTAPLVFAGAVARQLLAEEGVSVGARIQRIFNICDVPASPQEILDLSRQSFPVSCGEAAQKMREAIQHAKEMGDSVGGVVECCAAGLPAGWGDPFFDSMESQISALLFSIPAVKGVEFGDGFALAAMTGSQSNGSLTVESGKIVPVGNREGGILGGITSGAPLIVRAAFKPTPSISKPQRTVDAGTGETVELSLKGRHDPCIVPRAVPVVEAAVALCLLDNAPGILLKERKR